MAKFVFKLEALRKMREREERAHKLEVAELERQRLEIQERIRGAQRSIGEGKQDLREALGSGAVDLRGARSQAHASLAMTAKAQMEAVRLAGVMKRLETARQGLREASARRRAVDLLRDRRFEEWRREEARREAADSDEIGMQRAFRREE